MTAPTPTVYSIQYISTTNSRALEIADPAQRNNADIGAHTIQPGTYQLQFSYNGPTKCSLITWSEAENGWKVVKETTAGTAGVERQALTPFTVPSGTVGKIKFWGDQAAGYVGSLTVIRQPSYTK